MREFSQILSLYTTPLASTLSTPVALQLILSHAFDQIQLKVKHTPRTWQLLKLKTQTQTEKQ